ncbi:hypothetical protein [Rhodopirellula sp. MGV]|uniref:hypothetical protein n=1 Tax=Rhodopirellula sp. MGV TaxID=2023130 RepID=UPI00117AD7CA|nr:hypothetical protein [Rhodopirellula sp. MGV]
MTAEHEALQSPHESSSEVATAAHSYDVDAVDGVLSAIEQNSELLSRLIVRLRQEGHLDDPSPRDMLVMSAALEQVDADSDESISDVSDDTLAVLDENDRLREENESLRRQLQGAYDDISLLKEQNSKLASKVADADKSRAPAKTPTPSLSATASSSATSWQERKQQIIEQLENGSFDAEEFISNLNGSKSGPKAPSLAKPESVAQANAKCLTVADAIEYIEQLYDEITRLREIEEQSQQQSLRYVAEIEGLKHSAESLEQSLEALGQDQASMARHAGSPATDHSDIVHSDPKVEAILSADELVVQERERLTQLQHGVEEKLREVEIRASLERAKLSRRTVELEKVNDNLKRQVEDLAQRLALDTENGVTTRWMQKLGLSTKK